MYYIQLDSETSLGDLSALEGIQVVAMVYGEKYSPSIKFHDGYILLDAHEETLIDYYNEELTGYINGEITALTMYVNDNDYELAKEFQDFLFKHGIRSVMMKIA